MEHPLQHHLPDAPWTSPAAWRLPGVQPLGDAKWLVRDEAYDGQMALRDRLIAERENDVHAMLPEARDAANEFLGLALEQLAADTEFTLRTDSIQRPDGAVVQIERDAPLRTLGRVLQQDVCIMQAGPDGHVLTGAILCFPASWTLAEKIGKPMVRIHRPVDVYDDDLARRVQRIFDGLKPGRPVWRANALLYEKPDLYSPQKEANEARHYGPDSGYLRSEKQVLMRLPVTDASVFVIHTYVVPVANLTDDQIASLDLVRERAGVF